MRLLPELAGATVGAQPPLLCPPLFLPRLASSDIYCSEPRLARAHAP
jgi:hypothetical protein